MGIPYSTLGVCPVHFPYPCPVYHPYDTGPRASESYIRHATPSGPERHAGGARSVRSRRATRPAPPPRRSSRHVHFTPPSSSVQPDTSEQPPAPTTHELPIRTAPRDVGEPTIHEEPVRTMNEVPFKMPSTYSLTTTLQRLAFLLYCSIGHVVAKDITEPLDESISRLMQMLINHAKSSDLGIPEVEVRHHWPLLTAAIQRCQAEDGFTAKNLVDLMTVIVEFGRGKVAWNGSIRMDRAGNMYATQNL